MASQNVALIHCRSSNSIIITARKATTPNNINGCESGSELRDELDAGLDGESLLFILGASILIFHSEDSHVPSQPANPQGRFLIGTYFRRSSHFMRCIETTKESSPLVCRFRVFNRERLPFTRTIRVAGKSETLVKGVDKSIAAKTETVRLAREATAIELSLPHTISISAHGVRITSQGVQD